MTDLSGSPDIILVLPKEHEFVSRVPVAGYSVRVLEPSLNDWWINIHSKAVPSFGRDRLTRWLESYRKISLPEGILVATSDDTGKPVATAGSISNSKNGMFPNGGQLAWVATNPEHQKKGLASWLCSLATLRLQNDGYKLIFVVTGDDMPAAISVYKQLGYIPYLYATDQEARWKVICEQTGILFEAHNWYNSLEKISR